MFESALLPITFNEEGNFTSVNCEQSSKQWSPIFVTPSGISTDVIFVFSKLLVPISFKLLFNITLVNLLFSLKAFEPILEILFGTRSI